jgi:hypothetical protein
LTFWAAIRIILEANGEFVYHPEESLAFHAIPMILLPRPLGLTEQGSMAFARSVIDVKEFMVNEANQKNWVAVLERLGMN